MKLLRTINNILTSILVFLIPVVLLDWFIVVTKIDQLKPIGDALGSFLNPCLDYIKGFGNFNVAYNDLNVDYTGLVLAGLLFGAVLLIMAYNKFLDKTEVIFKSHKKKVKEIELKKRQSQERIKHFEEMARNKVIYFSLKISKKDTTSSYLWRPDNFDLNTEINKYIQKILDNSVVNFDARKYEDDDVKNSLYKFVFYDITDAIDYAFYVFNKFSEFNKTLSASGVKVTATVGCHCSYNENNIEDDFRITSKICGLGGDFELASSELFKNKYIAMKEKSNLKFVSKGLYNIHEKDIEVFNMKIELNQ